MQIDRLTHDLTKRLTRRQLRMMTHDGFGIDFLRGVAYIKDATGKVTIGPVTSLFPFSRVSPATFRSSNGYLQTANENNVFNCNDLTGLGWGTSAATIVPNVVLAPDGTLTADKVQEDTATSPHFASQSATVIAGQTYTASMYVRSAGKRYMIFGTGKGGAPFNRAWSLIDFELGTVSVFDINSPTSVTNRRLENVGDGWFRISHTVLMDYTSTDLFIELRLGNTGGSYAGDGVSGIYAWGLQLQAGEVLGPLLTTTSLQKYDQPRLAHHDVNGNRIGYLAEYQSTNQVLWSQAMYNAAWTKSNATAVVTASVLSPDRSPTTNIIAEDATAAVEHYIQIAAATASNVLQTASIWVKANSRTKLRLRLAAATGSTIADFDLAVPSSTPFATSGNGTCTRAWIEQWLNGWYRISITGVPDSTSALAPALRVSLLDATGTLVYNGDGTSNLYAWGAQVEVFEQATSYMMTAAATTTRVADIMLRVFQAGEYNFTEGTLVTVGRLSASMSTVSAQFYVNIGDDGGLERIGCLRPPTVNGIACRAVDGGVFQATLDVTAVNEARFKSAMSWSATGATNYEHSVNGAVPLTSVGTLPTPTNFAIGCSAPLGGNGPVSVIESVDYYPVRKATQALSI